MIIVTGAAGFIGSCIAARLNEQGRRDLWLVDHLDDPLKQKNLDNKKYDRFDDKRDFLGAIISDRITDNVEALIHMGACSSTTMQDERYFQENNFEYTQHLAQWALRHRVRFIYASSAATYGDGSLGYSDDVSLIPRLKSLNLYGESKQKFDVWAIENKVLDRMAGLKFFNVFGPNEYHKGDMRSVVAKSYQQVAREGKMRLFKSYKKEYADGGQKRDFIYVKDAVDVVMYFFDHPSLCGVFNVGTGTAHTWNDLAQAIFKAVGKKPVIEYIEMPEILRDRYQYFTQADMTNLRKCGYVKSFTSLEVAVADYISYLKDQRYW